jgi:hypothetical protein
MIGNDWMMVNNKEKRLRLKWLWYNLR